MRINSCQPITEITINNRPQRPSPTVFVSDNLDLDTSKIKVVESIDLSFDLIVRTSKLTKTSHYNTYQQKLYRLVKFLKEERGIGYFNSIYYIDNFLYSDNF